MFFTQNKIWHFIKLLCLKWKATPYFLLEIIKLHVLFHLLQFFFVWVSIVYYFICCSSSLFGCLSCIISFVAVLCLGVCGLLFHLLQFFFVWVSVIYYFICCSSSFFGCLWCIISFVAVLLSLGVCDVLFHLLQFFFVWVSLVSNVAFDLSLFGPYLSFCWCFGKSTSYFFHEKKLNYFLNVISSVAVHLSASVVSYVAFVLSFFFSLSLISSHSFGTTRRLCIVNIFTYIFVLCVEVLRSTQPNWVMSGAVSLPNHTFTGQA